MSGDNKQEVPITEGGKLLDILKTRFEANMHRHSDIDWAEVRDRLGTPSGLHKQLSLYEMEKTGGEPDVIGRDQWTGEFIFCDCSPESPIGRRSVCYDRQAQDSRTAHKPENNAVEMAYWMGIELLTEDEYWELQQYETLDTNSSSWVKTPADIRKKGGALFGVRRYDEVFVYHNGAQTWNPDRGFRGLLRV